MAYQPQYINPTPYNWAALAAQFDQLVPATTPANTNFGLNVASQKFIAYYGYSNNATTYWGTGGGLGDFIMPDKVDAFSSAAVPVLIIVGVAIVLFFLAIQMYHDNGGVSAPNKTWTLIFFSWGQLLLATSLVFSPQWPLAFIFMLQALSAFYTAVSPSRSNSLVSALFNTIGLFQVLGNVHFIAGTGSFTDTTTGVNRANSLSLFTSYLGSSGFSQIGGSGFGGNSHLAEKFSASKCMNYYVHWLGQNGFDVTHVSTKDLVNRCADNRYPQYLRIASIFLTLTLFTNAMVSFVVYERQGAGSSRGAGDKKKAAGSMSGSHSSE